MRNGIISMSNRAMQATVPLRDIGQALDFTPELWGSLLMRAGMPLASTSCVPCSARLSCTSSPK